MMFSASGVLNAFLAPLKYFQFTIGLLERNSVLSQGRSVMIIIIIASNIELLLPARHSANSHRFIFVYNEPILHMKTQRSEQLSDFPKITQPVGDGVQI